MTHDGKKVEKKKTEIKEKNLNPVFDETLMFTVPYEKIRQTCLVISVMDYDRMGRNEPIGKLAVILSPPLCVSLCLSVYLCVPLSVILWMPPGSPRDWFILEP